MESCGRYIDEGGRRERGNEMNHDQKWHFVDHNLTLTNENIIYQLVGRAGCRGKRELLTWGSWQVWRH